MSASVKVVEVTIKNNIITTTTVTNNNDGGFLTDPYELIVKKVHDPLSRDFHSVEVFVCDEKVIGDKAEEVLDEIWYNTKFSHLRNEFPSVIRDREVYYEQDELIINELVFNVWLKNSPKGIIVLRHSCGDLAMHIPMSIDLVIFDEYGEIDFNTIYHKNIQSKWKKIGHIAKSDNVLKFHSVKDEKEIKLNIISEK